jgi:hypothetical protein
MKVAVAMLPGSQYLQPSGSKHQLVHSLTLKSGVSRWLGGMKVAVAMLPGSQYLHTCKHTHSIFSDDRKRQCPGI